MITLYDLKPAAYQGDLWIDPEEDERKRKFMDSLDVLTAKYNRSILTLAKGMSRGTDWQMKREYLSPCWTTNFREIPKVR